MISKFIALIPCLFVLLIDVAYIAAETISLQQGVDGYEGTEDTSIYADRPGNTNGAGPHIFTGATTSSVRRALIRFDLSPLPDSIQITNVSLQLVLDRSGRDSTEEDEYRLHRVLAAWGEGDIVAAGEGGNGSGAEAGDATWDDRLFEQAAWETAGGDFVEEPSLSVPVTRQPGTVVTFSGEGLIEDVRAWLTEPESNHGWILIGAEDGVRNARRFNSSENESNPPALILEFDPLTTVDLWEIYE